MSKFPSSYASIHGDQLPVPEMQHPPKQEHPHKPETDLEFLLFLNTMALMVFAVLLIGICL